MGALELHIIPYRWEITLDPFLPSTPRAQKRVGILFFFYCENDEKLRCRVATFSGAAFYPLYSLRWGAWARGRRVEGGFSGGSSRFDVSQQRSIQELSGCLQKWSRCTRT